MIGKKKKIQSGIRDTWDTKNIDKDVKGNVPNRIGAGKRSTAKAKGNKSELWRPGDTDKAWTKPTPLCYRQGYFIKAKQKTHNEKGGNFKCPDGNYLPLPKVGTLLHLLIKHHLHVVIGVACRSKTLTENTTWLVFLFLQSP